MSIYNYVYSLINDMNVNDLKAIDIPDKLPAFRKFLSEISKARAQKYTTKVIDNKMQIMRVPYYSIPEKMAENE